MSESNKAVFLSYASQDADAARRICEALRAAGIEVWFDQSELVGGDAWDGKIRQQIKECALFLPIISANTQARPEGYFRIEWRLADRRTEAMGKSKSFIVPITIDDTRDSGADVPDSFLAVQWTRLPAGETSAAFCARVKALLGGPDGARVSRPEVSANTGQEPRATSTVRRVPAPVWIAAVVVGLGVAGFVALRPTPNAGAGTRTPTSASASAPLSEARQLIVKARFIFQEGDDAMSESFSTAEELLKKAVALDVANAEAWAVYGQLSADMYRMAFDRTASRLASMRMQVERAMRLDPDSIDARVAQASAADYIGLDQAITERDLRALAQQAPRNYQVLRVLGRKLGRSGKVDEASAMFDRAAALAPNDGSAWCDSVAYLLAAGRFIEAEDLLARSLARQPTGRALGWELIVRLFWRGDLAGASAALAKWPAWNFLEDRGGAIAGFAALMLRDPGRALAIYQRMPRTYLHSFVFSGPRAVLTAFAHEAAGHREAAQADWQAALQAADHEIAANPADGHALYWRAWALGKNGQMAAAETIRLQLEQRGWTPGTYFSPEGGLAGLALLLGHRDQALAILEKAVQLPDKSEMLFKNYWVNYPLTAKVLELNPLFDSLREDERFKQLVARAPKPAAAATASDPKSIAVLAFKAIGGDKESEGFSEGISEELLNLLATVPGLRVAARASAFYFKDKNATTQDMGRQLNVAYLVDGSVQSVGTMARVTARLSRADTGDLVWSKKFDGELKNIFALQDDIAGGIAENLKLKLVGAARAAKEVNPEAYRLFLEGRFFWNLRTKDGFAQAEAAIKKAIALAPEFAQAHAAMADLLVMRNTYALQDGQIDRVAPDDIARARAEAQRAIDLDPALPDAYPALAYCLFLEKRFAESGQQFQKALTLSPTNAVAHAWHAILLLSQGQLDRGILEYVTATKLDPLAAVNLTTYAEANFYAQRFDDALNISDRAKSLRSDYMPILGQQARVLFALGRKTEAVETARLVRQHRDKNPRRDADSSAIWVLCQAGLREEAVAHADEYLKVLPETSPQRGFVLGALGRFDEALPYLERTPLVIWRRLYWDSMWDPRREDPRFQQLLVKLGCAAEYKVARETLARMTREAAAKK